MRLVGLAAPFNSTSEDLGFRETIAPGAFDRALRDVAAENYDVFALVEHDVRSLLGRTTARTVRLWTDAAGLRFEVDPVPQTGDGRDLAEHVGLGNVRGSSFAFMVRPDGEEWSVGADDTLRRRIFDVARLYDVSAVANPAYAATSVSMRSLPESRGATPFADLPIHPDRDRPYHENDVARRVREWASSDGSGDRDTIDWKKLRKAFFWYDSENPEEFGSYKLKFADVAERRLVAVARGIFVCAAVLQGARGGVDIPDGDRPAVKAHLSRYYAKMREEFGDESIVAPWEKGGRSMDPEAELIRRRLEFPNIDLSEPELARATELGDARRTNMNQTRELAAIAVRGIAVDHTETRRRGEIAVGNLLLAERREDERQGRRSRPLSDMELRCLQAARAAEGEQHIHNLRHKLA
jgi:HK97 family phage prohead protease